ncbi:armadillo-like helical domain-containing protein [Cavenderia fasciculata]|uniref:Armadillo-like helical domain-containing protein n=1 Tax=Cavenderia fasciculata TaxID=261658 RepID=F4Q2R6_CACFS|nr:armadillo-like helical domain-containing protein [Cavenderia fasciculata]EGG17533.1 armadillo-like helical domain-containing protein [Cavenderia fasciculata]|eukprot:XP_004356017.1 armadillo-like helical domain-containing protein [Cavenderia fasciculata]
MFVRFNEQKCCVCLVRDNGGEYTGPEVSNIQSPPTTPRRDRSSSIASNSSTSSVGGITFDDEDSKIPVYLGSDGTLYNKYYIAVKILGIPGGNDEQPSGATPNNNRPKPFTGTDSIFTSFPSEHGGFDNYFDYEQSVLDWNSQVGNALNNIKLPIAMGRTYSRPRITQGNDRIRKNSEASNDDSFSTNDNASDPAGDTHPHHGSSGGGGDNESKHSDGAPTIGLDSRSRSGSDASTGSFEGSGQIGLDGSSPIDGSPSSGSLTGLVNGTRSRSNSSTYFDPRINRSNSLSPKQSLQSRLGDSGDFKLGRGGSVMSMDEDRWTLSKDPWEAQLILQEPVPEFYNSFEEYEFAMRNWAIEVIIKTPVLPPHANQLGQLPNGGNNSGGSGGSNSSGDQASNSKQGGAGGADGDAASGHKHAAASRSLNAVGTDGLLDIDIKQWIVRSGLIDMTPEEQRVAEQHLDVIDRLFKATFGNGGRFFDSVALKEDKQWQKMPNGEGKINLIDTFDKWYRRKLNWHRNSLANYKGGIWSVHLLMPAIPTGWKESNVRKQALLPPLPIRALRRTDIQSEADGKRVDTTIVSPAMPMDYTKILKPNMNIQYILGFYESPSVSTTSPFAPTASISAEETRQYIKIARLYDRRLVHSYRFDTFYSWSKYPQAAGLPNTNQPPDVLAMLQSQKQDVEAILIQQPFEFSSILALVNTASVYLDKFQECFDFDTSVGIAAHYAVALPPIVTQIVAPTSPASPGGATTQSSLGQSTSSMANPNAINNTGSAIGNMSGSSPNPMGTPTKQYSNTPNSPHHLLASPPSRSGSIGSFTFGSPASNKILLSPSSHNPSLLANMSNSSTGVESPRPSHHSRMEQVQQQENKLTSGVGSSGSPSQSTGGSPRSTTATSPLFNTLTSGSGSSSPYTTNFYNYISSHTFPEILTIFEKVNSPLAHAKLSSLVLACLASDKGSLLIENIQSLYRIAQATTYFDVVPLDLYPYPTHFNLVMTSQIAKGPTQEVVRLVFMYYYLNIIHERVQFYSSNPSVISCINSSKKETAERIGNQIQSDKELLSNIFRALGRKSSTISHCFLFVLVQLMRMTDCPSVISFLKLKDSILPHLRDLCNSKFLHSQFAAKRVFSILQEDGWKEFLYAEYSEKDALISDLMFAKELTPSKLKISISKAGSAHQNSSTTTFSNKGSLLSDLALNMCISTLDGINSSAQIPSVRFLLNDQLFLQIYNNIKSSGKTGDRNLENLSRLFAYICKTAVRFSMIKKSDQIKINKKSTTEQEILISPPFMFELLSLVTTSSNEKPIVKNYMLESLRHLLKQPELFEILKKEANLYNKLLIVSCREGKYPEFNRNSWRLFFQIIRLHPGHIEFLEKSKYLSQFIDIINTNAGPVVLSNSLHYLTKLFALVHYENRRATLWKGSVSDSKHTEKDVKTLRDFFTERHMFIKIHMVYRRYVESFPGRPFVHLVNLYQAISTLPICQKLLKDTTKTSDYKEGFAKISKWFKDESTPTK